MLMKNETRHNEITDLTIRTMKTKLTITKRVKSLTLISQVKRGNQREQNTRQTKCLEKKTKKDKGESI